MMSKCACAVVVQLLAICSAVVFADEVVLSSGSTMECEVLSESAENVTVRKGSSIFTIPRQQVTSIKRVQREGAKSTRLPTGAEMISSLAKQAWVKDLEQIPATVIDAGVMKNVPYMSHRAGDYEMNVYGDPDDPAGIEIGIYRSLLDNAEVKEACAKFIASMLRAKTDGELLAKLNREKDSITHGELTLEITPPTAADAYGGWWVSVYSEKLLDKSRANSEEMKSLTVARAEAEKNNPAPTPTSEKRGKVNPLADLPAQQDWNSSDIARARPSQVSGGGRVYVRSYYRKDGSYVPAHTRRK